MSESEIKNKNNESFLVAAVVSIISVIIIGFVSIGNDMLTLLRWDLGFFCIGIAVLPITYKVFGNLKLKGYFFSKIIGLSIISYLLWMFSNLHIIKFDAISCVGITIFVALIVYGLYFAFDKIRNVKPDGFVRLFGKNGYSLERILLFELAFMGILLFVTWFLGGKVSATETERLMNLGFLNMLDKCEYLPPKDMWAAMENINYYYYGHYMCAFMMKLCRIAPAYAYTLSLNTIGTMCFVLSFLIVFELLWRGDNISVKQSTFGAIIAAFAVTVAGNMHYVIFYKIIPTLWDMLQLEGDKPGYWFASSTRYIGYIPKVVEDGTIEEFPSYILLLGDLHAHAIDIMVVLTIIGVLVAYALGERDRSHKQCNSIADAMAKDCINIGKDDQSIRKILKEILHPDLILCMFLIAIASMSNFWDYPIYFVVSGAVVLVINLINYGFRIKTFVLTMIQGVVFYIVINLLNFMFMHQFDKMYNGIGIVTRRSLISQLLVLWGLPIACVILLIIFLNNLDLFEKSKNESRDSLISFICDSNVADIFTLLLGLCGIGLVIVPEFIFVKDIYINGFPRANTMYKLTFEAYIMFGLMMGYFFARVLYAKVIRDDRISLFDILRARGIKRATVCLFVLWLCTCGYIITAGRQWIGSIATREYGGLDSARQIVENMGEESLVVSWINENIKDDSVILTADGDSYTDSCVVSALTGHPTVLGWHTHEWLWHNGYEYVSEREFDTRAIYETKDAEELRRLIHKYNVKYIYIGCKEYEKYGDMNYDLLFSQGNVIKYFEGINAYIIEMNL